MWSRSGRIFSDTEHTCLSAGRLAAGADFGCGRDGLGRGGNHSPVSAEAWATATISCPPALVGVAGSRRVDVMGALPPGGNRGVAGIRRGGLLGVQGENPLSLCRTGTHGLVQKSGAILRTH